MDVHVTFKKAEGQSEDWFYHKHIIGKRKKPLPAQGKTVYLQCGQSISIIHDGPRVPGLYFTFDFKVDGKIGIYDQEAIEPNFIFKKVREEDEGQEWIFKNISTSVSQALHRQTANVNIMVDDSPS